MIMKKILLSFLMLFAVGSFVANAEQVTIDPSAQDWTAVNDEDYGQGFEATYGDIFVGTYKVNGTAEVRNPKEDGEFRHYMRSIILMKSVSGKNITKIEVTVTREGSSPLMINGEEMTIDSSVASWSGSAAEVQMSFAEGGQYRYSQIVVTTEDGGSTVTVAKPTFSPAAGTYYEAQSVTLSAEDGASIYYTTNGDDPTTSSTLYSEAIEVAQTTTIKAIAVKDGVSSAVASATYTIVTATKVASIAEMLEQEDGTLVEFSNPVTAVFQDGQNLYVADESGSAYFYGNLGVKYENGDVIPAGVMGTFEMYYDVPELKVFDTADSFVEATENKGAVEPKAVAVADVTNDLVNQYIKISKVTITSEEDGEYTNYYANSGSDRVWIYSKFSTFTNDDFAALEAGKEYDVTGIVTVFKSEPEIYIVSVDETSGVEGVVAEADVKVLGLDGEIAIMGEAADVEVYNMGGALIAKGNLERISCPQGIYVVKVDGNVQKVIVK